MMRGREPEGVLPPHVPATRLCAREQPGCENEALPARISHLPFVGCMTSVQQLSSLFLSGLVS